MSISATAQAPIRTTVPARLDRLNWSPFHTRMVAGLGAAWILDGLQITIASSVTGVLTQPDAFVAWGWDFLGSSRSSSIIDDPDSAQIDWGDDTEEEP